MVTHIYKNYLRSSRKKLALSQKQMAAVLGLKSSARISALELGYAVPTIRDCATFRVLFRKSFEEIWPRLNFEFESSADLNIRRLITRLEQDKGRSERKRMQAKIVAHNLTVIIDGEQEDLVDLT